MEESPRLLPTPGKDGIIHNTLLPVRVRFRWALDALPRMLNAFTATTPRTSSYTKIEMRENIC